MAKSWCVRAWALAAAGVTGCGGPQALVTSGPAATLAVDVRAASTSTNLQAWRVSSFEDASCKSEQDGVLVARRIANSGGALEPFKVPAGKPVTIGIGYVEARYMQNRECSFTFTFTPQEQASYRTRFEVNGEVDSCVALLVDANDEPVAVSAPEMSCVKGLMKRLTNGGAGHLQYKLDTKWTTPIYVR
ncbi:hypothetical protein ACFJIX_21100 [Roseateles sp. UC29_93]|uniref:hypothetical protein n=1 Tax=Roseateles sp. UC29_93 TaxID=3350177 RepID=UPI00366BC57D